MEQLLEKIKALCISGRIAWTNHALLRMIQRQIDREDIKNGILVGEIIENYPDDYPYPSCLILSANSGGLPLHIVCGVTNTELWIITAYRPNLTEWKPDFKTRREKK